MAIGRARSPARLLPHFSPLSAATDAAAVVRATPPLGTPEIATISKTKAGFTVGGGVEGALAANWTVKAEYLYARFGSETVAGSFTGVGFGGAGSSATIGNSLSRIDLHVARVGVNYKFGGPVYATF